MNDPAIVRLAQGLELVPDPELDKLYPKDFAGWVAVEHNGKWERVDILNPTGSIHVPIDAAGITEKFRGINPHLDTDAIAACALAIEKHSARELLDLLTRKR
jgi:2-methylcitrate dehydratase PrpD